MFGLVMNPIPSERMKRKAAKTPEQALEKSREFAAVFKSRRRFADGESARNKLARMKAVKNHPMPLSAYEQRLREKNAQRLRDVPKD